MEEEFAWLREGDVLFGPGNDWWENASVNYITGSFYLYASGYLNGAKHLVDHALQKQQEQDDLIYPIAFLYRQYLELMMKGIIKDGRWLLPEKVKMGKEKDPFQSHSLGDLWTEVRAIFEIVWPDGAKIDLDIAHSMIKQFEDIDKQSQAFRYPLDKKGNPSLPQHVRHINLRNLQHGMERISNFLKGGATGVGAAIDANP